MKPLEVQGVDGRVEGDDQIHVSDRSRDCRSPSVLGLFPGGRWDELVTTIQLALGSGRAEGLEITIFNPRLDDAGLTSCDPNAVSITESTLWSTADRCVRI